MADPEIAVDAETGEPEVVEQINDNLIAIRVTKFGEGKVSTGNHKSGTGDIMAARGAILHVDQDTAKAMEKSGVGEIVE